MNHSSEKLQYEKLTSFFKYLVGITMSAITLICAVAGFLFWSSGKEMREEFKSKNEELENGLKTMQEDFKLQKETMQLELSKLSEKSNSEIEKTRINAIGEIENIKTYSSNEARSEARNKINEVFTNKNFDDFVAKIAKERMEPQIINLVDKKLSQNEKELIDQAINNIESLDKGRFILAVNYLQTNPQIKLNNIQIQKIINSCKAINDEYKLSIMGILLFKKSELTTDFFTNELEKENNPSQNYAIQYFAFNNIDYNKFEDIIYNIMKRNSESGIYINSIETCRTLNKVYVFKLLNSTVLINLFKRRPAEEVQGTKDNLYNNLKSNFSEKELKSTLLYK